MLFFLSGCTVNGLLSWLFFYQISGFLFGPGFDYAAVDRHLQRLMTNQILMPEILIACPCCHKV